MLQDIRLGFRHAVAQELTLKAVVFTGAGGNEVVRIEERPDPEPGSEEVVVRARFGGLNPADTVQRAGHYPAPPGSPPDIPGLEVAGIVATKGSRVTAWGDGDRVFGLVGGGGLADTVAVHERHLVRVPDRLSDDEAAAVPEAFITAHDAISTQADLRPGETLLVHGAAGGVGSAAIQLGRRMGARPIGTSRSPESASLVADLGGEAIASEGFADQVLELTDGAGADVILELVGAPNFPENLRVLAPKGRIVVVGVGAGHEIQLSLRSLMGKRASIRGTLLRARPLEEKALAVRAFGREVVPGLSDGSMRAVIDSVLPLDRITDAFDRLDGRGKLGKVLVEF